MILLSSQSNVYWTSKRFYFIKYEETELQDFVSILKMFTF